MKKIIIVLFLYILVVSPSFAWKKKENPVLILSNHDPRTETAVDEKLENQSVFPVNSRIYFLIYTKEGFKSDYIKYQIVKQDDKAHMGGFSRIRNITKRVDNKNMYVDYFVISQPGKYFIQVFDIENLHQWLAIGAFIVADE